MILIENMKLEFYKYQATGNDFIMINNMDGRYDSFSVKYIPMLCDRKFGVGADGLIILKKDRDSSFYVDYYNADGTQSFCGNGARCSVAFARQIGLIHDQATFGAIDGMHFAEFLGDDVKLEMSVTDKIGVEGEDFVLNTGSPHYCRFDQTQPDIIALGREIRYSEKYTEEGINVNTIRIDNKGLSVQTYERGVENETLSCGTGVTACALIAIAKKGLESPVRVQTKGGTLYVEATVHEGGFNNVFLVGPAKFVFKGALDV